MIDEQALSTFEAAIIGNREQAVAEERQRIAAYVLAQLLGGGREPFDVILAPSVIRGVCEAVREGRYGE